MTDTAEADLAEIWAYIAADSESAATHLLDKFKATCARLLDFPSSGASRDRLARGLRVVFQGNYAVYYTLAESEIIIVRILHSARDPAVIAEHGSFFVR
ncbi:type II toxin-antitoxin system RelE/ParE family toxin [Methylocystis hirsuta]|uniref:type II toxin-antitoxin system RelE/ParE family toxin n=1 Tax=Methylocystis hirsuta TaxID=369798 RepID=UPI0014746EFD|nr:type II toxin-antitoxin system RelE/ParE family toxin [Methylocystis hirsuta]